MKSTNTYLNAETGVVTTIGRQMILPFGSSFQSAALRFFVCLFLGLLILSDARSQMAPSQPLNLDFEQVDNQYPAHWESFGSAAYKIYEDSTTVKHGNYAAVIESSGSGADFRALALKLPSNYKGKQITLQGYIKTENVTGGYGGLWLRIDPQIAFDNMSNRGVTGTTDWKKYQITLPLKPERTDDIVVGGLLVGKGKMWLDDLKVTIDGKALDSKNIELYTRELTAAQKDTAFDKESGVVFPELTQVVVTDLELLGRIWGFLKYYHPAIATGDYNWDYELFRMLPDYLRAKDVNQRNAVLSAWIEKYGKPALCERCRPTDKDAVLKPDLSWIDRSDLSDVLKISLHYIYNNRTQGNNYYITSVPGVGNPEFTNENAYENMPYPDAGFRLLSLYRYWNMIEYFAPYKALTDKNWSDVLKEYITKFLNAKNELEYELAALQVIGELDDTHANLWGGKDKVEEFRGNNFAPFKAAFVEDKLVVTEYLNPEFSDEAKLKAGDVITQINGRSVERIVDSLKPYYPASNLPTKLRDMASDMLRSSQNSLHLSYVSEGQAYENDVPLYDRSELNIYRLYKVNKNEKSFKLLDGNIGYVTLANIKQEDISEIKKTFENTKGIIIDIRNYPSFFVPFALGSYFVSQITPFVKFSVANLNNPGEFQMKLPLSIPGGKNGYRGKLVVLVNEISQSQAEYTAMAFRAGVNTTIVGSTTAGADGNVSTIFLPGGLRTLISGIGVYYPDGTETQRVGIVPDVELKPSIEGVKAGRDELLEKAVEIINQ